VLVEKRSGLTTGNSINAVRDEYALVEGTALLHLVAVDKDDTVAEAKGNFLALAQQPAGGSAPLGVLVVGAVVG